MRPVSREDIVDFQSYGDIRDRFRARVLELKKPRRIHVGDELTFLFENRDTVRYQIQEMMRAEQIVREREIQHEIETYNELVGGAGELGCTLLIEIDEPEVRDAKLRDWKDLMNHVYIKTDDGARVGASFDPRQVGDDRLSSVQYLKFLCGKRAPIAVGVDHPRLTLETELTAVQREALQSDLDGE